MRLAMLLAFLVSLASGAYGFGFAAGPRGIRKSVACGICVISALVLLALLGTSYFRFVLAGLPIDW